MRSIASLDAQNRFGEMLDTSQREPVLITRRGRPVSLVLSPANDIAALRLQFARAIGELAPLRGPEAAAAMETAMAGLGSVAAREGLTEQDIARMADAER
ncbi:type II toxin-antitoxin system prevent-host-death family antitoxin [Sphingomonas sp. NCPPB 2930]